MEFISKSMGKDIAAAVKRVFTRLQSEQSPHSFNAGQTQTGESLDTLVQMVARKADQDEVIAQLQHKTNKSDTEVCFKAVDILHQQLIHC